MIILSILNTLLPIFLVLLSVKKIYKTVKCSHCKERIIVNGKAFLLQDLKNEEKLISASADIIDICMSVERVFRKVNVFQEKNVRIFS